jgi:hypothetical protein
LTPSLAPLRALLRQYLHWCTSKSSKVSTWAGPDQRAQLSSCQVPLPAPLLHTSAYVSICQHTSAYVSIRAIILSGPTAGTTPASRKLVSIRQHTTAYVSIRQHTSAYVSIRQHTCRGGARTCIQEAQDTSHTDPVARADGDTPRTDAKLQRFAHKHREGLAVGETEILRRRRGKPYGVALQTVASYLCIRQRTSAYVSIAYVSIRRRQADGGNREGGLEPLYGCRQTGSMLTYADVC